MSRVSGWAVWLLMGGLLLGLAGCTERKPVATEVLTPTTAAARAQLAAPDNQPFLRIETGMHTAMIRRIAVDQAERFLVTASDDKTARVWDLNTGQLLQVLRPPMGKDDEGKLYAVAMSPDGETVAVGGFTGNEVSMDFHIYLFDRATAQLKATISGLPNVITHLAYSKDGRYLAAALGAGAGVRLYDSATLKELGKDSVYGDKSYWLDFAADGRLVSSCYDGFIRLYDKNLQLISKSKAPSGHQPYAVRFAPNADKIAVGFDGSTEVNVLAGADLHFLYAPDTGGINNGDLSTVAWSQDGQTLYAGGVYDDGTGLSPVIAWTQAGLGQRDAYPLSSNTIMDLIPLQHRQLAYGAQDPIWGVLDSHGQKRLAQGANLTDFRGSALRLNNAASVLAFDDVYKTNKPQFFFDLNQQTFLKQSSDNTLVGAITELSSLNITDWKHNFNPKLNNKPLALKPNETSRAVAISPDRQHFLLGTEWYLRYYDRLGQQQWQTPTPSVAWAVNLSADNRYAVAAFGDGTIRWYNTTDHQEQLALFPLPNGKDWVLWTPEGFYSASPDAEPLIGYHLNQSTAQGLAQAGQFVAVKQLREHYYRPDLIAARLNGNETPIREALANIGDIRQLLKTDALPPRLELVSKEQNGLELIIHYRVIDQGGGIGKINYRINGVEQETRGGISGGIPTMGTQEISIPLAQGDNTVELIGFNQRGTVSSSPLSLSAKLTAADVKKPGLYVLAVGVSDYKDRSMALHFADQDASAVASTLSRGGERLFNIDRTHIIALTNREVTLDSIQQNFAALAQQMQPQDVFILYLAGHGKVLDGSYHFIPSDAVYTSDKAFRAAILDESKLRSLLATVSAQKSVIILDTCYAGKMAEANTKNLIVASARGADSIDEKAAISRLMRATGRAVIAAATDSQLALEGYQGHGYFTSALLEGLVGGADTGTKDHYVSVLELGAFLGKRVPEISKDRQFPIMETEHLSDFPLSVSK